jgi:gamma-glutamyl:cysteine ligase YbdK (ATP-grasp superfamily)
VDYFVSDRLTNPLYNKLWGFVLNHPLADELRNELAKTPTKLINATFNYNQVRNSVASCHVHMGYLLRQYFSSSL